jgi:hypothetical protein
VAVQKREFVPFCCRLNYDSMGRTDEITRLLPMDDDEENENSSEAIFRYGKGSDSDLERSDESVTSQDILRISSKGENGGEKKLLSVWTISCILSSSFAYGCIMTTLFLITLPIECERIEKQIPSIPKSVSLAAFKATSKYS